MAASASRDYQKRKKGMVRRLFLFFSIGIIVFGVVIWIRTAKSLLRDSIVLVGNPTVIISWEPSRSKYVIITIPPNLQVDAIHGYGMYSIESLWKLDTLEKRRGAVFLPTLVENFAVPIRWYSAHSSDVGTTNDEIVQFVTHELSFLSLVQSLLRHTVSFSFIDMVRIWRATRGIDGGTATVLDFRSNQIATTQIMPDGSPVQQLNKETYDGILGDILEDVAFRQETIRLAIYNTTSMPGIGSRVARVIEHLGGYVVFVGNDDSVYDGMCELVSTKERLQSITSTVIQSLYGCKTTISTELLRGDMVLRLGKLFEKRYLPF